MKPGSVIVDLAVETGGNCALSARPARWSTKHGVKIVGHINVPAGWRRRQSALRQEPAQLPHRR